MSESAKVFGEAARKHAKKQQQRARLPIAKISFQIQILYFSSALINGWPGNTATRSKTHWRVSRVLLNWGVSEWVSEGDGAKSNLISYYNVAECCCFCRFQTSSRWSYNFLWMSVAFFLLSSIAVVVIIPLLLIFVNLILYILLFFVFSPVFYICCFSCASLRFFYILISTTIYFALKGENRSLVWIVWRCLLLSGIIWKWRINQTLKISYNVMHDSSLCTH